MSGRPLSAATESHSLMLRLRLILRLLCEQAAPVLCCCLPGDICEASCSEVHGM